MIMALIIELAVGLLCVYFGLLIWIGKKVTLIHDYQVERVKEKDIPAYAREVGIGVILVGVGICVCGLVQMLLESKLGLIGLAVGVIAGVFLCIHAQMRYGRHFDTD